MFDSPMIYSVHTVHNGGLREEVEHYLSAQSRLDGMRTRIIEISRLLKSDVASMGEEELCAVLEEILAPTQGSVSLTEAELKDEPQMPVLKQLFVVNTQDYDTFTRLYPDTEALLAGLIEKIFAEGETFFSDEIKTEVHVIINSSHVGSESAKDLHATVLNEVSELLEDGPYAVYVNNVTVPV